LTLALAGGALRVLGCTYTFLQ